MAGRGPPQARRGPPMDAKPRTYAADPDDLLDQHVAYYFRHHPEVYRKHNIVRKRPGVYELNGREIGVEWQYGLLPGEQGFLVALDGRFGNRFQITWGSRRPTQSMSHKASVSMLCMPYRCHQE